MRINNNVTAQNSHRQLGLSTAKLSTSVERLSSGMRVNRAADDAAGLAISEKMRTQIRGLNRASLNIQDGISLTQVADGALQSVHDKMQRLRELAVQSANGTNEVLDREAIQLEFGQLTSEINQLVHSTNFNGRVLFDGSIGASWEYNLGIKTTPYTTTLPAADDFQGPVNTPGWTPPTGFGSISTVAGLGVPTLPTTGVFAMQLVTPADGTLNVILDFGVANSDGSMTVDDFRAYFVNGFNSLGLGQVVSDITHDFGTGQLQFHFPNAGGTFPSDPGPLTGVMGQPIPTPAPTSSLPRVFIGLGPIGPIDFPGEGGVYQQATLNGVENSGAIWASGPFRTHTNTGPITPSTVFTEGILGPLPIGITPPAGAPAPDSGFPSFTMNVAGDSNPTTILLQPGTFQDAESFINANRRAFETATPRAFDLSIDDETGRLLLTTRSYDGGDQTITSFVINPTILAEQLGFGGVTAGDAVTERDEGGFLWIQSGANQGDGILIEIPRICTRSLGLSIRRPEDETTPGSTGFPHISELGSDGYTTVANVQGDPNEYSLDVTSHERASNAISVLDNAINIISLERARIGAQTNRMEFARLNVENTSENLQASESRIRDTDMALEMTTLVRNQILQQSGTAMLAQANALPQATLQLLG
ncbi:MAG: hypothetical protein FWC13_01915 [Oscillospiraceae bacterium]|nr:hypothetical protein [Oscillospiraceae bacterium]